MTEIIDNWKIYIGKDIIKLKGIKYHNNIPLLLDNIKVIHFEKEKSDIILKSSISASLSLSEERLLLGLNNGEIFILNKDGIISLVGTHRSNILHLYKIKDEFLSVSLDGVIKIWNIKGLIKEINCNMNIYSTLLLDGKLACKCFIDKIIKIVNLENSIISIIKYDKFY